MLQLLLPLSKTVLFIIRTCHHYIFVSPSVSIYSSTVATAAAHAAVATVRVACALAWQCYFSTKSLVYNMPPPYKIFVPENSQKMEESYSSNWDYTSNMYIININEQLGTSRKSKGHDTKHNTQIVNIGQGAPERLCQMYRK